MKISKRLKLEPHASPKPWPMQFPLAGRRLGGDVGNGLTSGRCFIGCLRLGIKTNSPSMTTHDEETKDELHSFYPLPQLPTLLAGLFCDRAIHSLPCTTLFSLTHTHALFSSSHTPNQPTPTCYITGWEFISLSE